MGKYSALKETLPTMPADVRYADQGGADYQKKIDAEKAKLLDKGMVELAEGYKALRAAKDAKEEELSKLNLLIAAHDQLLVQLMDSQHVTSFKLDGGGTFILMDDPQCSVKDKAANRQWFIEKGLGDILSVPWQTQNAMVKGIIADPLEPDPDNPEEMRQKELPKGIEVYMRSSIQMRKK